MKFLEKYRKDILQIFENQGFTKDDFSFIKRKGRIVTEHHKTKSTFSFFRKKETRLNEITKQFEHSSRYEVKADDGKREWVENWEAVINAYEKWLVDLKNYHLAEKNAPKDLGQNHDKHLND